MNFKSGVIRRISPKNSKEILQLCFDQMVDSYACGYLGKVYPNRRIYNANDRTLQAYRNAIKQKAEELWKIDDMGFNIMDFEGCYAMEPWAELYGSKLKFSICSRHSDRIAPDYTLASMSETCFTKKVKNILHEATILWDAGKDCNIYKALIDDNIYLKNISKEALPSNPLPPFGTIGSLMKKYIQ